MIALSNSSQQDNTDRVAQSQTNQRGVKPVDPLDQFLALLISSLFLGLIFLSFSKDHILVLALPFQVKQLAKYL